MRFRPCIDIHNGKVKQIVGGSLRDGDLLSSIKENEVCHEVSSAKENFVSEEDGAFYGSLYKKLGLTGGHIILLNPAGSEEYKKDIEQAKSALDAFPGGLMIGGGITADNAGSFLEMGATHIIVTSYVFKDGKVDMERLSKLKKAVGKERIVLDLSCRKRDNDYYIVTDRWQKFTEVKLDNEALEMFKNYADEFLIHAVDVEGKSKGIEEGVARLLGDWGGLPITYAGGVGSLADIKKLKELGKNNLDVTVGSALSIFGGNIELEDVIEAVK